MNKPFMMLFAALLAFSVNISAQQKPQEPDIDELAQKEAERLETLLKLEDWQTFYVDSTLKHNYAAMMAEIKALQGEKVSNSNFYYAVQDKWSDATDDAYRRFFTDEQWNSYLKSGAAKARKARAKRQTANK